MSNPIYSDIKFLKGVGEKRANLLYRLNIKTVLDLMEYFPRDYINREIISKIADLEEDKRASLVGFIANIEEKNISRFNSQLHLWVSDGDDFIYCTWFKVSKWLKEKFKTGQKIWVSGYIRMYKNHYQIVHPEFEILDSSEEELSFWHKREISPVYPLTEKLKISTMRNLIYKAFELYHQYIEENLPEYILKYFGWKHRRIELQKVHFATSIESAEQSRRRFAFEELFYSQLMLARVKKKRKNLKKSFQFEIIRKYTSKLKENLPFELTKAQIRVINEIVNDMQKPHPMSRLLQGDVGSGKTIVTLFAILLAIENGYQAAMMAPTELLAEQHYFSVIKFLKNIPQIKVALLKGGNYKGKKDILKKISTGEMNLVIGTHALIQKDVTFHNLGFIAIDEQHRFGVEQRSFLSKHNQSPHLLYLSATPIPRSLALSMYGDLDISIIDQMPPGRKKITTVWKSAKSKNQVFAQVEKELSKGRQAYFVCPLIEESEKMDLLDAETLYNILSTQIFKNYKVELLHGKMKASEKDTIMQNFKEHKTDILVSTTVIEVGIDVPNATVMVIEHAERFGLSQLHQLRGRVGRGAEQSFCYLISYNPISSEAKERLTTMVETTDGFKIAEKDLEIRGPGDFFGTKQSGFIPFKFANVYKHRELLQEARRIAFDIIETDYNFDKPKNEVIKKTYFKKYAEREKLFEF